MYKINQFQNWLTVHTQINLVVLLIVFFSFIKNKTTEKCMQKHQDATRKHLYILKTQPLENAVTAVMCSARKAITII